MKLFASEWRLKAGLGFLAVLVVIQVVPYGRDHTNPPTVAEPAWDSPDTRALAQRACFDCHSNETHWPAYARLAPVSWLIQHDVDEGRAVLNFSEWQRPQKEAKKATEELRERSMPPATYQLMHSRARFSGADRDRLARGLAKTLSGSDAPDEGHQR